MRSRAANVESLRVKVTADNRNRQKMHVDRRGGSVAKARKGRRRWVIVIIMAIAATAFVLAGWVRRPAAGDLGAVRATFTARTDELIVTVVETGNIKAQQSTDIICDLGGRGIEIASIVPEGTVITQEDVDNGRILCQLNSSDLEDYYSREKTELSEDHASYLQAQEAHLIQLKQNESDLSTRWCRQKICCRSHRTWPHAWPKRARWRSRLPRHCLIDPRIWTWQPVPSSR